MATKTGHCAGAGWPILRRVVEGDRARQRLAGLDLDTLRVDDYPFSLGKTCHSCSLGSDR